MFWQILPDVTYYLMKQEEAAPRLPLDLHLILGSDDSGKEIANINIKFELKSERISSICQKCELKEPIGNDVIFKLDFVIQEGREKECLEYFENGLDQDEEQEYDYDLSPLQNWFKRPKKSGKLQLYESNRKDGRGGVTLEYRFYQEAIEADEEFVKLMKGFDDSSFHPDVNLSVRMLGRVETFKKSRIKIKPDQVDLHVTSQEFKLKDLQSLVELLGIFGEDEEKEEIVNHPIYSLLKEAEQIQGTVRMASLGKMLDLYEIGLNTYKTEPIEKENEPPEVIKGLFKSQLRITFIYASRMAFVADCTYENEAVLMRLLTSAKKYRKLFD